MPPGEYASLKAFFGWMMTQVTLLPAALPAEAHPIAALDAVEAKSMAMARKGLAIAIGDTLELCEGISGERLQRVDAALAAEGLMTLTAVRARFGRKIRGIMKRGAVRSETEYYALRNIVEALPEDEREKGWAMLAAFEAAAS